jgi:hypothetical protein
MANELQKFTDKLMELASGRNQRARDELVNYLEEQCSSTESTTVPGAPVTKSYNPKKSI